MHLGIAGAGLAGRLLAWRLLRAGHAVTVIDQDDESGQGAAGFMAAAMLAPVSESVTTGHALLAPGMHTISLWRTWLDELFSDSGERVSLHMDGSIVVAHPRDHAELQWFRQCLNNLEDFEPSKVVPLNTEALRALEPALTTFKDGLHLPQEGWIDNRPLFAALRIAMLRLGGEWLSRCTVTEVTEARIGAGSTEYRYDHVFDCRGVGAKPQSPHLRGVRGELLWIHAPEVQLRRPIRLMHPRYQLYVAPRPNQIYVIGATEIESESMAPVTVRSQLELLSALYSVHAGFAEASILEARSHCRPAFEDNLPRISCEPGVTRLNGLYRHGYLLGPLLIESALAVWQGAAVQPPIQMEYVTSSQSPLSPLFKEICHA
jgi:glycine oxidase